MVWLANIGVQTGDSSEQAAILKNLWPESSGMMRWPTCEPVLDGGAEPNCEVWKLSERATTLRAAQIDSKRVAAVGCLSCTSAWKSLTPGSRAVRRRRIEANQCLIHLVVAIDERSRVSASFKPS